MREKIFRFWGYKMIDILESANNIVLQSDLEQFAQSFPFAEDLKDSTVLITGATGLIGSTLTRALACLNRKYDLNIKILALARSREKARRVLGKLLERQDVLFVEGDVMDVLQVDMPVDYVREQLGF